MSANDGPGADPEGSAHARENAGGEVHTQLVEALVLLLIEKGVLTKNDALSIVQTVAQVQRGTVSEGGPAAARAQVSVEMLQRLYGSFVALPDGSGLRRAGGGDILQLRPPVYGEDRPEFPPDE